MIELIFSLIGNILHRLLLIQRDLVLSAVRINTLQLPPVLQTHGEESRIHREVKFIFDPLMLFDRVNPIPLHLNAAYRLLARHLT